MRIPGFTAEVTCYRTRERYQLGAPSTTSIVQVVPQQDPGCRRVAGQCTGLWGGRSTASLGGYTAVCTRPFQYAYVEICTNPYTGNQTVNQGCALCVW